MADLSQSIWNLALQPLKSLYLHYHNAYGHQTWQGNDLPQGAPKAHFDHVVLRDHVTNQKHISTTRVPMATKLNRM